MSVGGDLNSSVSPVLLYASVSPCSTGRFSVCLDLLFLPSKNVVPSRTPAFSSTRLLWCYYAKAARLVALGILSNFGLQSKPGPRGCVHPLASLSLFVRWVGSGGSTVCRAVPRSPRSLLQVTGHEEPLRCARLSYRCVACCFRTWGHILGSVEPWKSRLCSSPPGTRQGLGFPRKLMGMETVEGLWKSVQIKGSRWEQASPPSMTVLLSHPSERSRTGWPVAACFTAAGALIPVS